MWMKKNTSDFTYVSLWSDNNEKEAWEIIPLENIENIFSLATDVS